MWSKIRFKLQSLILVTLIPMLLVVTVAVGGHIYGSLRAVILQGFDRKLSAISSVTGAFVDGDEHARILKEKNEKSALYLDYVLPMQRISRRAKLTFLYSHYLQDGPNIVYVLDDQVGELHSFIGDKDTIPLGEVAGAHRSVATGTVHLSEIRTWDQWGVLKSGFAPIFTRDGRATAQVGADVNISKIRDKTGVALAQVGITSIIALLTAGFLSITIARNLTRPMEAVKGAALRVAAGQYGQRIEVERPRELAELAASFNGMSATLADTVQEWSDVHRDLEQRRRRQELCHRLGGAAGGGEPLPGASAISGAVTSVDGARTLAWLGDAEECALGVARLRCDIATVLQRLVDRYGRDWETLSERLTGLFVNPVTCFALIDREAGTLRAVARQSAVITLLDPAREVDLAVATTVELKPGQEIWWGRR